MEYLISDTDTELYNIMGTEFLLFTISYMQMNLAKILFLVFIFAKKIRQK